MTRETISRDQIFKLKHDVEIDRNARAVGPYMPEPRTLPAGSEFRAEGWVDDLSPQEREEAQHASMNPAVPGTPPCPTWFVMAMNGNPAALQYFFRMRMRPSEFKSGDVLYGHVGALGYMLHRSEIE